ncbi:dynamin family protein, partial [Colletotrichum musicola]
MAQVALNPGALGELSSVETRALLDITKKLSSLGIGRITNPPQIDLIGDRSSGKSSVLEAISHVKFPIGSGGCTRFATELVLRNGSQRRVKAAVRFHQDDQPARKITEGEDIGKVIAAATKLMGLCGNILNGISHGTSGCGGQG